MLMVLMATLLIQGPQDTAQQAPVAQPAPAAAPTPPRTRRGEAVVCQERPPTGSTLRRTICSTERRAEADRQRAQGMLGDATSGVVNGEMSLGLQVRIGPGG